MRIEIFPVGYPKPTRFDLVGVDKFKNKFFLGYCRDLSQAEVWRDSILKFAYSEDAKYK